MIFQFSLESGMSLSPTTECFRYLLFKGQDHVPLPSVKVVAFLRDKYKSVMSTSRQRNGTHGFLMSLQQVHYHLKVEQLFARRPRRGLVAGADGQSSGITPVISMNTSEIYKSLRYIG
jgi:hypothetical protein